MEQKCAKKLPGTLPNSKPAGTIITSAKMHSSLNSGIYFCMDSLSLDTKDLVVRLSHLSA